MGIGSFTMGVVAGLTAAAVGQELAKQPGQRTWRGKVAGVPYNFRVADWNSIATEYWNPASDTILTPHVIGLGWGVNVAALTRRAQRLAQSLDQQAAQRDTSSAYRIPEPAERS